MKKDYSLRIIIALIILTGGFFLCFAADSNDERSRIGSDDGYYQISISQDKIDETLSWTEKKKPEDANELRQLLSSDPEAFEAKISTIIRKRRNKMIQDTVFGTVGGLGLFLFGMGLMSEGLKKAAGQKLKKVLESMTKKPLIAFLVGAGITALIQSSSATTVMVVGFVNAALLTLKQAICVIIGTNVGTTATAWLVSISGVEVLKITHYALPAIAIGFLMQVISKRRQIANLGQILLGFGILFIGINFMKDAFGSLQGSDAVKNIFIQMGGKPLLAILVGMIFTTLLQSSSASIGIVQLLAMQGAFGADWHTALNVSIPFVLGSNIGTTITAQLAALRTNLNARRTAWAHTIFNVLGAAIAYPFIYLGLFRSLVLYVSPWELGPDTIGMNIAVAHTVFNLINSAIFLPFSGTLEIIVTKLVKKRAGEIIERPVILEEHLLDTPTIALEQTKRELVEMARVAKRALMCAIDGLLGKDRKMLDMARKNEDSTDDFQFEITSYLSELSRRQLSDEVSNELPVLLHTVNDLERIGDHAVNIVEIAERKIDKKQGFSDQAVEEAQRLRKEATEMFDRIIYALETGDKKTAESALQNEENLNRMQMDFRRSHVRRIRKGLCSATTGLIFIDLVDNVEKIGDHLTNIAQSVMGGLHWDNS